MEIVFGKVKLGIGRFEFKTSKIIFKDPIVKIAKTSVSLIFLDIKVLSEIKAELQK